ncbi:MAG: hypothetical protein ACJ8AW_21775 [Rhodopila sp.]
MARSLDPAAASIFETRQHFLIADGATCVGIPKTSDTFASVASFTQHPPHCIIFIDQLLLQRWLDRFAAAVAGRAGDATVQLEISGDGPDARVELQPYDGSGKRRGAAKLACSRRPFAEGVRLQHPYIRLTVILADLRRALGGSTASSAQIETLLNDAGMPVALRVLGDSDDKRGTFSSIIYLSATDRPQRTTR